MKSLDPIRGWLTNRPPRERVFLLSMLIVVSIAALLETTYTAKNKRDKLLAQIPRLEHEVAAIHSKGRSWRELKSSPVLPSQEGEALLSWVRLSTKPFGNTLSIQSIGNSQISLKGTVPFDKWLVFLGMAQKNQRLYVQQTTITPAAQTGLVNISAELARPEIQ